MKIIHEYKYEWRNFQIIALNKRIYIQVDLMIQVFRTSVLLLMSYRLVPEEENRRQP